MSVRIIYHMESFTVSGSSNSRIKAVAALLSIHGGGGDGDVLAMITGS